MLFRLVAFKTQRAFPEVHKLTTLLALLVFEDNKRIAGVPKRMQVQNFLFVLQIVYLNKRIRIDFESPEAELGHCSQKDFRIEQLSDLFLPHDCFALVFAENFDHGVHELDLEVAFFL